MVDLKVINGRIKKIGNGENTFRSEMATLSRELLSYVPETGDVDAVNRLLAVLTPKNKEIAQKFFGNFLAHKWEKDNLRFGKKSTNKDMVSKRRKATETFLSNEDNTIWTWMAEKAQPVERPVKPKEYAKKLENLVHASLEDEKEAIDIKQVIRAIIAGGAKLSDIMQALDEVAKEEAAKNKAEVVAKAPAKAPANDQKPREREEAPRRQVASAN